MRATVNSTLSIVCAAGAGWLFFQADAPPPANSGLTASVSSKHLGSLRQGATGRTTFELRNDSDTPLEITAIASSCGCTAAVVGTKSLQPGETTELKATLDVGSARGGKITRIDLGYRTGDEAKAVKAATSPNVDPPKSLVLQLTADVVPHYDVTPTSLTFGPDDHEQTITLSSNFDPPLEIKRATCPHPAFQVEPLPTSGDGKQTVRVRFDRSRWEDAFLRPRITIVTSSPYQTRHRVGVSVTPTQPSVAFEESRDVSTFVSGDGR